jgi:hypothetical protein
MIATIKRMSIIKRIMLRIEFKKFMNRNNNLRYLRKSRKINKQTAIAHIA